MNEKEKIFKRLKQHYNYLIEKGYEVIYLALQGSQNYNLQIDTDEYKSDIDTKAIILPSFEDFISGKEPISEVLVMENEEHIDVKDIRVMFKLFEKQNIQFLEILFTQYRIINKNYKELVLELLQMNDEIAKIDHNALWNCMAGMSMEKLKALEHPYPAIIEKINKWGYDGKQLHHIIRINEFMINLNDNKLSYADSLVTHSDPWLEKMMKAKLNEYSLEEARILAKEYNDANSRNKNDMLKKPIQKPLNICDSDKYQFPPVSYEDINIFNQDTVDKLTKLKINILKKYFESSLLPKSIMQDKVNPNSYRNVWITSDLHLGHDNVLDFENRIEKMKLCLPGECYIDFTSEIGQKEYINVMLSQHDKKLIENWNSIINNNDLVYILGDFSFAKMEDTIKYLKQMKGDKILVIGNHDCIFLENKKFDKSLFVEIVDYKEINYQGQNIVMMHYPLLQYKHIDKEVNPWIHLHGHIHSTTPEFLPRHSFNVGVDVNNYKPIKLEEAIKCALCNNKGGTNGRNFR